MLGPIYPQHNGILHKKDIFADIQEPETLITQKNHYEQTRRTQASIILDSPDAGTYQRILPFIMDNYGTIEIKDLNKTTQKREKVTFWNFFGKIKRAFKENDDLATKLEHTPLAEQYAIAAKLSEYDKTQKPGESSDDLQGSDMVSPETLEDLRFLNKNNQSVLKSISHLSTISGEIAMTALFAKSSKNLMVSEERQKFIKLLAENPNLLYSIKDKLNQIKASEPLLFSNYRPFKKERLRTLIKGDTIKKIITKIFKTKGAERFGTMIEIQLIPALIFIGSTLFAIENSIDLLRSFDFLPFAPFKGQSVSNPGRKPQGWFRSLGKIGATFFENAVKRQAERNSWKEFLSPHNEKGPLKYKGLLGKGVRIPLDPDTRNPVSKFFSPHVDKIVPQFKKYFFTKDKADCEIISTAITSSDASTTYNSWLETKITADISDLGLQSYSEYKKQTRAGADRKSKSVSDDQEPAWREKTSKGIIARDYLPAEINKIYNKLGILFFFIGAFIFFPKIEFELKAMLAKYLDIKNLYNSVQAPLRAYKNALEIHKLLSQNDQTAHLYQNIIQSPSAEWKSFIQLTSGSTFNGPLNPITIMTKNIGTIIQSYSNLMRCREEMSSLIRFYGELDAYVSMAILIRENLETNNLQGTPTRYCFADFIKNEPNPRFDAVHFWNPLLSPTEAIPNILSTGEDGLSRNIIITGAHGGGKTTNLKAIFMCILMAQTFGIAPAEKLHITFFDQLFANFRNSENAASKNSRFQTEALNMIKIMHKTLTLPSNRFYALFSDEALSGTQIEPAVQLIKRFCFKVAKKNNIFYASSTHYNELSELEVETRGIFKNFKVDAIHLPDGKLYRPHKMLPGVGESSSAFDAFAEALDKLEIKNKELSEMIADAKSSQAAKDQNIDEKTFFPATYFF